MVLSKLTIGAIINTSSGGCDSSSERAMLDILKGAGLTRFKTWCGEAEQMERCFTEAAAEKVEVLVVLGGDGTIRTAAEACNQHGTYLIPLPGGTMNMLPRALYGDVSWQDALRQTLDHPVTKILSGGRAADSLFFVAAIVGTAALWVETRESIRDRDFVDAVEKGAQAFQTMFDMKIRYSISPENNGEAEVVAVICPIVSKEMLESEQALEAAAIDVNSASELIRLVTVAAVGEWRTAQGVTLNKTKRITLQSGKDIPLFLDGERVRVGDHAEITFVPRATQVIVPGGSSS